MRESPRKSIPDLDRTRTIDSGSQNRDSSNGYASERNELTNEYRADEQQASGARLQTSDGEVQAGIRIGVYDLVEKIGQGGMGSVWKAKHTKLDRWVAIKLLPSDWVRNQEAVKRFEAEMRATAKIEHPNIVKAFDAGEYKGNPYLVTEYVEGWDLSKLVKSRGTLSVADCCKIMSKVALGLSAAHELGVVHRDIKPSNILLSKNSQVKILDLGLARNEKDSEVREQLTKTGQLLGTPSYMAPEQWGDVRLTDCRADLYAMGCTIYYLLVGTPPFSESRFPTWVEQMKAHTLEEVPSLLERRSDVPIELEQLYRSLLSKSPADRPASALDVSKQLTTIGRTCSSRSLAPSPEQVDGQVLAEGMIDTNAKAQDETMVVDAPQWNNNSRHSISSDELSQIKPELQVKPHRWKVSRGWLIGLSTLVVLLMAFGVIYSLKTPYGELVIELSDPTADVQIRVDGNEVKVTGMNSPLTLTAGEHGLTVVGTDFETVSRKFVVKKSEQTKLAVELIPTLAKSAEGPAEAKERSVDPANDQVAKGTLHLDSAGLAPSSFSRIDRNVKERYSGVWKIEGGEIVQSHNGPTTVLFGDNNWVDYDFSVEMKTESDTDTPRQSGVICYRAESNTRLYTFSLGAYEGKWAEVAEWIDNKWSRKVGPIEFPCPPNQWQRVSVAVRGNRFTCTINDQKLFDYEDDRLKSGKVGLRAWTDKVRFRNLRVTAPDKSILWEGLPVFGTSQSAQTATLVENGEWKIENGELVQTRSENAKIFFGSDSWSDFDLTYETKTDASSVPNPMGSRILYRIVDSSNLHRFSLGAGSGAFDEVSRFTNGVIQREVPTVPSTFVPGEWFKVDVKARANRFVILVNGKQVADYQNDEHGSGKIGFSTWNAPCRWRNIRITDPAGIVLWEGLPEISSR